MLTNFIKIAFRNIRRNLSYTLINVSGLTLGITCALLIFSIVSYHLSFDDFHQNNDRIYRFVTESHRDEITYSPSVPPAFAKVFRADFTYGEKVARICTVPEQLVSVEQQGQEKKFKEVVAFAEREYFDIFNFPLIAGDHESLLTQPNTAAVTERIARKYFGEESPVGKTIRFNNNIEFTITAVLNDIPDNTDLRSEIYFSYATMQQYNAWYDADDAWGGIATEIQSFVLLRDGVSPEEVEAVLPTYVKKYRAESKNVHHYKLQPLADVHFNPKYDGKISKTVIWVLSLIGFLLIVTACLNFINLATAQAINRSKEVGVRKTLGSARGQIFWQFTTETGAIVLIATCVAFALSYSSLPYINELFNSRISLSLFSSFQIPLFLALLVSLVTMLAGFYPGLVLSGFRPVLALKGALSDRPGSLNIRRALITTQFVISQVLLLGLIVVMYQMWYVRQADLGFNQDGIVMIPAGSKDVKMITLRSQLAQIPQVETVSLCFAAPSSESSWGTMFNFDNRSETEEFSISFRGADENYLSTFDIDLVAGRNLIASDSIREFLVNETLVRNLGYSAPEEVLGKSISILNGEVKGPIVGVVNDFHDQSFKSGINPVFMTSAQEMYNVYALKINMRDASSTLSAIREVWTEMYPDQIFEYDFLDDQIASFYKTEETMLKVIQVFAGIALAVGCMGLFGLVSFMASKKTKEIGIRKILGGTVAHILWIFGKEFSRLVIVAFLVAAPIGWWLMSRWLENYAYRVKMAWWIFGLEVSIILVLVIITVGYQSVKTALANPVRSLKAE